MPFQQREKVAAGCTAPHRPDKLGHDMKLIVSALRDDDANRMTATASLHRDEGRHVGHVVGWLADPDGGGSPTVRWSSSISDTVSIL